MYIYFLRTWESTLGTLPFFWMLWLTVYPKKYAHGFVVLCFVVVMQSFIMNSHEVFIHIHQGCFAGTGAIVRLPQCQWSKPDGYGKISQCITTTKHSKAKTVCVFLGIYCMYIFSEDVGKYPRDPAVLLNVMTYPWHNLKKTALLIMTPLANTRRRYISVRMSVPYIFRKQCLFSYGLAFYTVLLRENHELWGM